MESFLQWIKTHNLQFSLPIILYFEHVQLHDIYIMMLEVIPCCFVFGGLFCLFPHRGKPKYRTNFTYQFNGGPQIPR